MRYRNAVFSLADGRVRDRVDKAQLVAFAEAAPFAPLRAAGTGYEAGGAAPPARDRRRAGRRPDLLRGALPGRGPRSSRSAGAELLFQPSNDFWMSSRAGAALMLRSAAFRAIEERRWLVRATPTGISALIDPHGRVAARAAFGGVGVLHGNVRLRRARTPYARVGDAPVALAALWAVTLAIAPRRPPRKLRAGAGPMRAGASRRAARKPPGDKARELRTARSSRR